MRALYTGLAIWNLGLQIAFLVLTIVHAISPVVTEFQFPMIAMFVAFFSLIIHSLLIIHFIGSMKWIQQSGPTAGIDDTRTLRRAWIKGPMFPLVVIAMLNAVAVGILSGGFAVGDIPAWIPITLTTLGVVLHVIVLPLARTSITDNKQRIIDMQAKMNERVATGEVSEDDDGAELLPESASAGGKTLIFLGINVWLLYAYNRFVMRDLDRADLALPRRVRGARRRGLDARPARRGHIARRRSSRSGR